MFKTIGNSYLTVTVSSAGAELFSVKSNDGCEYLWQGDPKYWVRRSPNLFPIVGTLPGNAYRVGDQTYYLEMHGFAKTSEFELVEAQADRLFYKLTSNEATLKQYPYHFELYIGYLLQGNQLIHRMAVSNIDDRSIRFSIGAHPGFNCPLEAGERMEDYVLEFEKRETVKRRFVENNLLNGREELFLTDQDTMAVSAELFTEKVIILEGLQSKTVALKSGKSRRKVTVNFDGFPYLGIWSAPGPFVCIEPWFGITSSRATKEETFETKEGMLTLEAGKRFECEYSMSFE